MNGCSIFDFVVNIDGGRVLVEFTKASTSIGKAPGGLFYIQAIQRLMYTFRYMEIHSEAVF